MAKMLHPVLNQSILRANKWMCLSAATEWTIWVTLCIKTPAGLFRVLVCDPEDCPFTFSKQLCQEMTNSMKYLLTDLPALRYSSVVLTHIYSFNPNIWLKTCNANILIRRRLFIFWTFVCRTAEEPLSHSTVALWFKYFAFTKWKTSREAVRHTSTEN